MNYLQLIEVDELAEVDYDMESLSKAVLPDLPRIDEMNFIEVSDFALPPINRIAFVGVIKQRRYAHAQGNQTLSKHKEYAAAIISESSLNTIGLPSLPKAQADLNLSENVNIGTPTNVSQYMDHQEHNQLTGADRPSQSFAMAQYGTDDAALNRVLSATSELIDRMSTQSAVDCLIEMPVWMRNIFLARFGVSRVVGVMLSARLDAAGEISIVGSDGELSVHNIPGPVLETLSGWQLANERLPRESLLDQLVMVKKTRNCGVKIKNNNPIILQEPTRKGTAFQRTGPR
jgi:hypothetical protein